MSLRYGTGMGSPAGPRTVVAGPVETLPGWHTHRESATGESRPRLSTRSTRVPEKPPGAGCWARPGGPGRRHRGACEDRPVDLEGISALLSERWWALLVSLPTTRPH